MLEAIIFVVALNTLFVVVFIAYILNRPGLNFNSGAIPVKNEEFLRLLAKEEQPLVFYRSGGFSYFYYTSVKGNRICTRTKNEKLKLPEHCELLEMKAD